MVGFVINRFRGDIALLQSGLDWLEKETDKPVLGVLPYLHGLHIEAEDAVPPSSAGPSSAANKLKIIAPIFPHISNHTDLDALRLHPDVDFQFVKLTDRIPSADLIILPGSKNVRADLQHLIDHGWDKAVAKHLRYNGKVLGICGGFQMLGEAIHDPYALEGAAGTSKGLAYLEMETTLEQTKQLKLVQGKLAFADANVAGYEIHMGVSAGRALHAPALYVGGMPEGAISADNQIAGTYVHGVFDHPQSTAAWLKWAGLNAEITVFDYVAIRDASLNRLADCLEQHLDWGRLAQYLPAE